MRVIAGKARRTSLCTIEGMGTRPTTDRIKETLFNMINPYLYDAAFLDLFAGSGAIGIEALSRGAKKAVFVEHNKDAVQCIKKNLQATKLADGAEILMSDAMQAIRSLDARKCKFDFIFMDPPYNHEIEKEILFLLNDSELVHEDTIIIVEASLETSFEYIEGTKFSIYKEKNYKTNKHVFLQLTNG